MKYFTPELFARFQSADDSVADRADAEWEKATQDYQKHWTKIKKLFPESVRRFEQADVRVHDADVLSVARQGSDLILIVQEEPPASNLIILTFVLAGEPAIDGDPRGTYWLYEEFDVGRDKRMSFEVLLSGDVRIRIPFRAFRFSIAKPVLPAQRLSTPTKNGLAKRRATPAKK